MEYPINFPSQKMIKIKKFDYSKSKQVAEALPPAAVAPAPVPAPVEAEVAMTSEEPVYTPPVDIETLAHDLESHFKNTEPYRAVPNRVPAQVPVQVSSNHAVEEIGNRVDGVVVLFNPKSYTGIVRISKYGRSRSGLFFHGEDIVSGDLIGVGSLVRCLVGPANHGDDLYAREIEILPEEIDSTSETKIYEREENR